MTALLNRESFLSLVRHQLEKHRKFILLKMMIGITIHYILCLKKTFTSILSFASFWGHFSGVSGKLSPGWSGDLSGHTDQEEGARKSKAWSQFNNP